MAYLTPNVTPADTTCRALFIPNDEAYLAIVRGALQLLTFPSNWTPYGALSPQQAADNFVDMFDRFCFNEGPCRMIGEVIAYAGATSPKTNWLICDGRSLLRSDYPDLFAVINVAYGSVDSTHFNIPDLHARSISGTGTGGGLGTVTVGLQYGERNHILTVAEMPAHTHSTGNSALLGTATPPPLNALGPNPLPALTGPTGGGASHNNVGPRLGMLFLIVATD